MGRKPKIKKAEDIVEGVIEIKVEVEEPKVEEKKVSLFHFEFNNEGLNQLRDKINELIEFVNK